MQSTDPKRDTARGPGPRAKALARIREKLERMLHNPHPELENLRPQIDGIIDALHALNRDASDMQRHGHRGEHDID